MFSRIVLRRGEKQQGESPFWISFSDLMSALMMLFLVVMVVTLIAVTKNITAEEQRKIQRESDIKELMSRIHEKSLTLGVDADMETHRVNFKDNVLFDSGSADIRSADARVLREYVPVLLDAHASDIGRKWIRQIVVEGFTDQDGTYLYNLGLSLDRSQQVVCVLLARTVAGEMGLSDLQKRQIQDLFLVGGYSFNSMKASKKESRRVEFKIDFWEFDDKKPAAAPAIPDKEFGKC